jgi:uncharacterized coiled-coil protein SlyX
MTIDRDADFIKTIRLMERSMNEQDREIRELKEKLSRRDLRIKRLVSKQAWMKHLKKRLHDAEVQLYKHGYTERSR